MGYWYNDDLGINNIIVSSRVRIARNLKRIPFPSLMKAEDRSKLNSSVKEALMPSDIAGKYGLKYIEMCDVPETERKAMMERHTISYEFSQKNDNSAIIISNDEKISIMIGEEDHIRIQVIFSGADFESAYDIASGIDKLICEKLDIAFNERYGYLTECPTNLGTGLRVSAMMHLPILEAFGKIPYIQEWVNKLGFTIRGTYGEGSKADSSLYQISNQRTLGITEDDTVAGLKGIAEKLSKQELDLRNGLDRQKLEDDCFRALYTLKGARIISSKEMMELLSKTMIGISVGIIDEKILNPVSILINCQPYMLISRYGMKDTTERDIQRGNSIRESILL